MEIVLRPQICDVTSPHIYLRTVTHPSTNRARRRATWSMRPTPLPVGQTGSRLWHAVAWPLYAPSNASGTRRWARNIQRTRQEFHRLQHLIAAQLLQPPTRDYVTPSRQPLPPVFTIDVKKRSNNNKKTFKKVTKLKNVKTFKNVEKRDTC